MVLLHALISSHTLAAVFASIVLTFLICVVEEWLRQQKLRRQLIEAPVLNLKGGDYDAASREYKENLRGLLKAGYVQFKNGLYQLWRPDGYVTVISRQFIDELKGLPTETLDFHAAVQTNFIGKYKWVTLGSDLLARTILEQLTQQTCKHRSSFLRLDMMLTAYSCAPADHGRRDHKDIRRRDAGMQRCDNSPYCL